MGKSSWYLVEFLRKLDFTVDVIYPTYQPKTIGPIQFWLNNMKVNGKKYDLVHSNEGCGLFVSHPCMIETYHHDYKQSYDVNSLLFYQIEKINLKKARKIIVPSYFTKDRLLNYGYDGDKITVIHHGIDQSSFKNDDSLRDTIRKKLGIADSFVVITVGQLIKRKQHQEIMKAMQNVANSVLILVGKGPEKSHLLSIAHIYGVKTLHFEHVSEEFLVGLYNAADVYVHTAVMEGFGLSVLEAMSCSLPVIAYETADFSKIIQNSGFIIQQSDVKELRESLLVMQKDENLRKKLGLKAFERSNAFTWQESARKHAQLYLEVYANA